MNVRIANAPCSWGVMGGFDASKFPPPEQVLAEIAETGYAGTELGDWGYLPTDARRLKDELERRSLHLVGALVPISLATPSAHPDGLTAALRTAELLRNCGGGAEPAPFVILADANGMNAMRTARAGSILPEHGLRQADWRHFADGVNHIAEAVRDGTGLRTVFHHHCAGWIETPDETDRLMELTDPDLVGLCFDTGHWAYGGGDILAGFARYRSRIWHVHFKDCHPAIADEARQSGWDYFEAVRRGVFYGLGGGTVDFGALVSEIRDSGYDGWIVVEDELPPGMGDAKESAMRDREFMRGLGL